jgi:hypothetical protein
MLVATWITAIATGLLAALAFVTAWYASRAFRKQAEEVSALQKQVEDQEKLTNQQAERERRAQASMISGWSESISPGALTRELHLVNMSDEPVYNVNVFLENEDDQDQGKNIIEKSIGDNTRNKRFIRFFAPKQHIRWDVSRKNPASEGPKSVPRVAMFFNDKNGARWLRNWDGGLTEAEEDNPDSHRPIKASDDVLPPHREFVR